MLKYTWQEDKRAVEQTANWDQKAWLEKRQSGSGSANEHLVGLLTFFFFFQKWQNDYCFPIGFLNTLPGCHWSANQLVPPQSDIIGWVVAVSGWSGFLNWAMFFKTTTESQSVYSPGKSNYKWFAYCCLCLLSWYRRQYFNMKKQIHTSPLKAIQCKQEIKGKPQLLMGIPWLRNSTFWLPEKNPFQNWITLPYKETSRTQL